MRAEQHADPTLRGWTKRSKGEHNTYLYRLDEHAEGVTMIDGELWTTWAYWDGELVDFGQWESRDTAFRMVERACKAAVRLRSPCTFANKRMNDRSPFADEDDDD